MSHESSPVLTIDEAARYLRLDVGVTTETAHRYLSELVTAGRLRKLRYASRPLFRLADLDTLINADGGMPDAGSGGDGG